MSIPVWVLLAFAAWTLLVLITNVGTYRLGKIFGGESKFNDFPADRVEGSDFYRRSMRAHLNCVENLPVYGAIVLAIVVTGLRDPLLDTLALIFIGARVVQSLIHLSLRETHYRVGVRFSFFFIQIICMGWMGLWVALHA